MLRPLVAIPIKPFGVAKGRLAPMMDARTRSIVGRQVAARTLEAARQSGARTVVATGDDGVRVWASDLGFPSIDEREHSLAGAAHAAVATAAAAGVPWIVVHADLPLIHANDLRLVIDALATADIVLAPSYDGGTTVVAGVTTSFDFSYGNGSFRRHLAAAAGLRTKIVVTLGLALDLDRPSDLRAAMSHPRGAWLRSADQ